MTANDPQSPGELLQRLEELLLRQLDECAQGRLDELLRLSELFDEGLRQLPQDRPLPDGCAEALARVRDLHQRLCLALAHEQSELGERLRTISGGRRMLSAYGRQP